MFKEFMSVFFTELSYMQKKEIRAGYENGLDAEDVSLYARSCFNFLQMEQIRLALQHGMGKKNKLKLLDAGLSAEQMKARRERIEHGELIHTGLKDRLFILTFSGLTVLGLLLCCTMARLHNDPVLKLKTHEVNVMPGETVDPAVYIGNPDEIMDYLTIPPQFSADEPGSYVLVFAVEGPNRTYYEKMLVHVLSGKMKTVS